MGVGIGTGVDILTGPAFTPGEAMLGSSFWTVELLVGITKLWDWPLRQSLLLNLEPQAHW